MVAAVLIADRAPSQQLISGPAAQFSLSAPQFDLITGAAQARLEQAQALAAEQKWDEAVDVLREVATNDDGRVVAVNESTYVDVPTYRNFLLTRFPAYGLVAYRQRVDATAASWYRAGLADRDEKLLNRVVDETFCSSWGDEALLALGELALERADFAAARRNWHAISPQLRDPQGRPAWNALHDVDFDRNWSAIRARWQDRPTPPDWLAYPDTNLELADMRACLIVVSIREGDFDRAVMELELFRRLHPRAEGRLAGGQGLYVPALERLLKSARDWPVGRDDANWTTFAGTQSRNGIATALGHTLEPMWPQPVKLHANEAAGRNIDVPVRETDRPLSYSPLLFNGRVYYGDARRIYAIDLTTGKPAFGDDGVIYHFDPASGPLSTSLGAVTASAIGVARNTMTIVGNVLYARLGERATSRAEANRQRRDQRLVGIDLAREGLLTFDVKPDDGDWSFDGAPVSDGRRVYVAMRRSDIKPAAYVACFGAATGRREWRTSLGAADTLGSDRGDETTHNLLTLVGDRIFFNSNLGFVAALDAHDGQIAWLRRYDRIAGKHPLPAPLHFDRDPSPCVYDRGLVFVAPADAPTVFALDADTGQTIWSTDRLADVSQLLGVAQGRLIATGNRLWAVDARSGRVELVWPESEYAGVRGFGRGVVAGGEIFWPTRDRIYVFDLMSGQQSRAPIDLIPYSDCGANLVVAEGRLLVVSQDRMMALGPHTAEKPKSNQDAGVEAVATRDDATRSPRIENQ